MPPGARRTGGTAPATEAEPTGFAPIAGTPEPELRYATHAPDGPVRRSGVAVAPDAAEVAERTTALVDQAAG